MKLERAATPKAIETTFYVTGDTGEKYTVHFKRHKTKHRRVWTCNCRDFTERQVFTGGTCKHIDFVIVSLDAPMPQNNNVLTAGPEPAPTNQTSQTVKSLLAEIVTFLQRGDKDADYLWAILSALRGPDKDSSVKIKRATTGTIRSAIGLKTTLQFVVNRDVPLGIEYTGTYEGVVAAAVRAKFADSDYHFLTHYEKALEALVALGIVQKP